MGVSFGMFGAIECHPSYFSYVRGAPPYLITVVQTSFDKYELPYSSRSIKTEQPLFNTAVINRNTTPLVFMPVVKQNRSKCVHVSHLGAETAGAR